MDKVISKSKINIEVEFHTDGCVNEHATRVAFENALAEYTSKLDYQHSVMVSAVNEVINGLPQPMPYVLNKVLSMIAPSAADWRMYEELAKKYIRVNSGTRDSGKAFGLIPGKNGGVVRWWIILSPNGK